MAFFFATVTSLYNYFEHSLISISFFIFLLAVAILNIIREIIVRAEKKNVILDRPCIYLVIGITDQSCGLSSRKENFKRKGNSCDGCTGKNIGISKEDLEDRARNESAWKSIIILLAKYARNVLPYMSFFYTLAITLFEK